MKSKILAFILACSLCLSFLAFPVSASPLDVPKDFSRFLSDLDYYTGQFESGQLSKSEYFSKFMELCVKLGLNLESDVSNFKDVLRVLDDLGVDVAGDWLDWLKDRNAHGSGGGSNVDNSVLNGYGAVCQQYYKDVLQKTVYCAYGIIYKNPSYQIVGYPSTDLNVHLVYTSGSIQNYSSSTALGYLNSSDPNVYVFYGDWRYEDGTAADDQITDFPEKQLPNYDDPDVPEDDLIDFLEDLLQDLMLEYPDMSTIEGLLAAILNKLGTLDSDNDNALLSDILTAIQALKNNGETSDNSDLVKTLEDLKNALIFKDGDNVSSLAQLLNELVKNQVRRSDITIDPSLYNQRFALIQAKLLGKFSFISSFKSLIDYSIEKYSTSSGSPLIHFNFDGKQYSLDFSMFDNYIDPFRWLLAAFIYLSYVFKTFRKIPGYINGGDNS